jgi:hypothetical protein
MAAAGCLPFVPASGGASEIVTAKELRFKNADQAVERIISLLNRPNRAQELRAEAADSANRFAESVFTNDLRRMVGACLNSSNFTGSPAPKLTAGPILNAVAN